MIDLGDVLEEYSARGAEGADRRFGDPKTRAAIRERVAHGKRRANLTVIVAAFAVIGVSAGAWAEPIIAADPAHPSPTPNAPDASPVDHLPALDAPNYLVEMTGAYRASETLTCNIIPIAPMAAEDYPSAGSIPPLPTWIESDRIYGLANELPPSYPIPLYSRDGSQNFGLALNEIPQLYPKDAEIVVALIAEDGSWWGFDARYQVIYAMPHDPPGIFVSLTPNADCHGGPRATNGSHIPPGHYDARVMVNRTDIAYGNVIKDFGEVEVITGLPSFPSPNATK